MTETVAERLIDLAWVIRHPIGLLVELNQPMTDLELARMRLSLAFDRLSPATKVRAIVEEWDYARVIREVY